MSCVPKLILICLLVIHWMRLCKGRTKHVAFSMKEHSEIGFMIGDLHQVDRAFDPSEVNDQKLDFKMPRPNDYVSFSAGKLFVKKDIDREAICTKAHQCCCLDVLVYLHGPQAQIDYVEVRITIADVNDHAPSWPKPRISLNVPEHTKKGTKYRLPSAVDLDSSPRFTIAKYSLEYASKKARRMFSLVSSTDLKEGAHQQLWLRVDGDLDRETEDRFQLRLVAKDGGEPPLSGSTTLLVNVTDVNDNVPFFESATTEVYIRENNQPNDFLCQVVARDKDVSDADNLRYSFGYSVSQEEAAKFHINDRTGKVYVKKTLDYENDPASYYLPIQVTDGSNVAESTLVVKLLNENDNAPVITLLPHVKSALNTLMVYENSAPDKTLATITTTDVDNHTTTITCKSLSSGFDLQRIDAQSGSLTKYVLSLGRPFDRESEERLQVVLICSDDGYPQQTSKKLMKIEVLDRNDCTPQITSPVTAVTLRENLPRGSFVVKVNATDCDTGSNARLAYGILGGHADLFRINRTSGVIRTNAVFDREGVAETHVVVAVYDRNNQTTVKDQEEVLSSSTTLRVAILDVNDCFPVFSKKIYEFSVAEESPPKVFVGSVSAVDADVDPSNRRTTFSMARTAFEMKGNAHGGYFYVSEEGVIYTGNRLLDREQTDKVSFVVEARDGPFSKHVVSAVVMVTVEDINDNHPQWLPPTSTEVNLNVSHDETVGRIITILRAVDSDIKDNSDLRFEITQGNELGLFRLDSKSGSLYLERSLPKNGFDIVRLVVKVSDHGKVPQSNTTTVKVKILRDSLWLSYEGRHLEKDLVVMICMISVTLIVSGILIVAIVLLKCKPCFTTDVQDVPCNKDNRPENPDGRSSPTVSDVDISPRKVSSDFSMYHSHICRPRGFIYEAPSGLMGFEPLTKPNNVPLYYTFKARPTSSELGSDQDDCYQSQSPQMIAFASSCYPSTRGLRTLPSSPDSLSSEIKRNLIGNPSMLAASIEPITTMCGQEVVLVKKDGTHQCNHHQSPDKRVPTCVKWSDMVDDKGVYEAFCHSSSNTNSCQMSKDQITSFV